MTKTIERKITAAGVQFIFSASLTKKLGPKWISIINEACTNSNLLLGKMGMIYDIDFIYAITEVISKFKYASHNFSRGLLEFTVNEDGKEVKYEMHPVDSETRFYGSSQSSIGNRFRTMYGDMSKDWYCVKM